MNGRIKNGPKEDIDYSRVVYSYVAKIDIRFY